MEQRIKDAWRDYYSVTDSNGCHIGSMECHKCGQKITGTYLIHDRKNFMLRGNESDEVYLYHRTCSEDNEAWIIFDKDNESAIAADILRRDRLSEVKSLINKYGFDADDLFDIDYQY